MHRLLFLLLAGNLVACSTSSPVHPPADLVTLENRLDIKNLWQRQIGYGASDKYLSFTPLIEDKTGYSVDHEGLVMAWNVADGKVIWKKRYETSAASSIANDNKQLYFGTSRGELFAVSKRDGSKVWKQQLSSEVLSPPVSYGGRIVVRTVDGNLHALSASNGSKLWSHQRTIPSLTLRGTSAPVVERGIVISGADSGKLTALTLDSGDVIWETTVAVATGRNEIERLIDIDADPVVKDDIVYACTFQGRLAAIKIDSGRILWVRDVSSYSGIRVDSHKVYISTSDGKLWALDRFNGATLWKQDQLQHRQLSRPSLQGRYLVVGDFNGYLHWMAREDGRLLARTQLGYNQLYGFDSEEEYVEDERVFSKSRNILASPVVVGDTAIAITREGLLSAYQVSEMKY